MKAMTTKRRLGKTKRACAKNGSRSRVAAEFAPGSLEAKLAALGKLIPDREWANVPVDYFANLDHYRHGAAKNK